MTLQDLCEIGPYVLRHAPGKPGQLALSFASIGHDADRLPSAEFIATATGVGTSDYPRAAIFIQDHARTWANDPQFGAMLRQAVALTPPAPEMVAIGMSMGAFSALAASHMLPLTAVLAFAPQWSMSPQIMPDETRWQVWRDRLPPLRWPDCPLPPPGQGCQAYLFHAGRDDMDHLRRFPRPQGCDHILFADQTHSGLVPAIKARGALAGLMQAAFQGDRRRVLRIAASAGGKRVAQGAG